MKVLAPGPGIVRHTTRAYLGRGYCVHIQRQWSLRALRPHLGTDEMMEHTAVRNSATRSKPTRVRVVKRNTIPAHIIENQSLKTAISAVRSAFAITCAQATNTQTYTCSHFHESVRALWSQLPTNYNFEIHKTLWRIEQASTLFSERELHVCSLSGSREACVPATSGGLAHVRVCYQGHLRAVW
jgi:hypothetical protein